MKCRYRKVMSRELPAYIRKMTKKREFALTIHDDDDTVQAHDTFWSGGSRNEYSAVCIKTGFVRRPPMPSSPFSGQREPAIPFLKDGYGRPHEVIVEGGYSCGKPSTLHVHVPMSLALQFAGVANDLAALLKSRGMTLSDLPIGHVRDFLTIDCDCEAARKILARLSMFYGEEH